MCGGKMLGKLRYVFSQTSDSSGLMLFSRSDQFLKEALKFPAAVFEGPSCGYTEHSACTCFPQPKKRMLSMPLDTTMADPPPRGLVWLPLKHRLAHTEEVCHPVECSSFRCEAECSYSWLERGMGFWYPCRQLPHPQLCQNCSLCGHASVPQGNQHQVKEHPSWVTALCLSLCPQRFVCFTGNNTRASFLIGAYRK